MAKALKQQRMTAADDLRERLSRAEERVVAPEDGGGVRELFTWMDEIADAWPQLEAAGVDLRGERTRWESLQSQVRRRGGQLVRAWRAQNSERMAAVHPGGGEEAINWWWRLESIVASDRRRRLRRILLAVLAVALVVILGAVILSRLFPVDPVVRETFRLQQSADEALRQGDVVAAQQLLEQLVALDPDDPFAFVQLGVVADVQGDSAGPEAAWRTARSLLGDEARFLTFRGQAYLQVGETDRALEDEQAALAINPDDPLSYFFLGVAHELRGETREALEAYSTAGEMATESDPQLAVMARTRLANLIQSGELQAPQDDSP